VARIGQTGRNEGETHRAGADRFTGQSASFWIRKSIVSPAVTTMTRLKWISPFALSVLCCALPLKAQKDPPHFEVIVEGGGSFLNGGSGTVPVILPLTIPCVSPPGQCPSPNVTSSFSTTARVFAGFRFRPTPKNALEASYSFSPNRFHVFQPASNVDFGPGYDRVTAYNFNYARYLWARGPLQPFLTAGVGVNRFTQANASNGNQAGFNFGGGVDVALIRSIALRVEFRDFMTGQPSPIRGTSHDLVPTAGIVFRFH
jgi:hypothetical protein